MHNRDKYPEIWAAKEKSEANLKVLMDKRRPFLEKMKPLRASIIEMQKEVNLLDHSAMVDAEEIGELRSEISRLAKAMGAVVIGK